MYWSQWYFWIVQNQRTVNQYDWIPHSLQFNTIVEVTGIALNGNSTSSGILNVSLWYTIIWFLNGTLNGMRTVQSTIGHRECNDHSLIPFFFIATYFYRIIRHFCIINCIVSYVYYRQQSNGRTLLSYCACIQTIITHTIVIIRIYWHDSYISHKSAYHWSVSLFLVFWIKHSEDLPLRENLWDTVQNTIALYTVENTIVSYTVENTVENTVARYPFKVPLNCIPLKIPLHRTVQSTVDH